MPPPVPPPAEPSPAGRPPAGLPSAARLAAAADDGLHPVVHRWRTPGQRLAALTRELDWHLDVAARDLGWARDFAAHQPASGAPPELYLDRWLAAGPDLSVLAGPRYRNRDPARPFVEVVAADRPVGPADLAAMAALARREFAPFAPLSVRLFAAAAPGAWPGTHADMRLLAAPLAALRGRRVPAGVSAPTATDLAWYDRYAAAHGASARADPRHRDRARVLPHDELVDGVAAGRVVEVSVDGEWAGLVVGAPDVAAGLAGVLVRELVLDPAFRGRGLGPVLSVLLARSVSLADDEVLFGTVHVDNAPARRSALAAGRVDVGGEVVLPLA